VRIVNGGTPGFITVQAGLAEINAAMMGEGRKNVRRMSAARSSAIIEYRDGRKVEIRPAAEDETPAEPAAEWCGTHSNPSHLHRFGSELRAVCNSRIRSRGAGRRNGVLVGQEDLRTRSEIEGGKYAELYSFCPKCSADA
jgi:plasmid stabilization system protein ParE